jgi:hypothetical protein
MTDSEDGALEIHEITFDARDPHALAAFWAALLEREIRPGDIPQDDSVLVVPAPGQLGLLFLRVPEGKTAKNRAGCRRAGGQAAGRIAGRAAPSVSATRWSRRAAGSSSSPQLADLQAAGAFPPPSRASSAQKLLSPTFQAPSW